MTPANVRDNPALYYAWLQWAMRTPDPKRDTGNNANAAEQTREAANPLYRGPHTPFCLSADSAVFVSTRPVPDVEILAGRVAS